MSEPALPRRLAAIVHADIAGFSRLMGADEEGTHRRLREIFAELSGLVRSHGGRVVKYVGDAVLAEFPTVSQALGCAVRIQDAVGRRQAALDPETRIAFRIGVNLGEVIVDGDDIYGDGVNVAARLEALAEAGGICVSDAVRSAVGESLPLVFEDLGEREVKNIARPLRAYRVRVRPGTEAGSLAPRRGPALRRFAVRRRWLAMGAGALLALVLAVMLIVRYQAGQRHADETADVPTLAVLPFDNLGGDPEQDYFADGITEDLITDLSKLPGLFVIARNSSFAYRGRGLDVAEIARELGVRYVLEGSVRRAGDTVRVNAQLIDAGRGGHVWAERYDRPWADIFALQDELIGEIVRILSVTLTEQDASRLAAVPTTSLEAYDHYLRAERAARSDATLGEALALYEKAIALDPDFAGAYAGYALAALRVWHLVGNDVLPAPVARERAYEAASRALAREGSHSVAHSVLAMFQALDGSYEAAIDSAGKAVQAGPSNAVAYTTLAFVLTVSGEHGRALDAIERGLRIDPKPPADADLHYGMVLYFNRRYEDAVAALLRARDKLPGRTEPGELLAACYAQLGRDREARQEIDRLLALLPPLSIRHYAVLFRYLRRDEDLEHLLEGLARAGLPEWPFAFEGDPGRRLTAGEVATVTLGRAWSGTVNGELPFYQQTNADGEFAYRSGISFVTGRATVDGDMLCLTSQSLYRGAPQCGYLYRAGGDGDPGRYLFVDVFSIREFTLDR